MYNKIKDLLEKGYLPIIENDNGEFQIFSSIMSDGGLRYSYLGNSIKECKDYIGGSYYLKKEISKLAKENNWKIIDTMHKTEILPNKSMIGMKVEVNKDSNRFMTGNIYKVTDETRDTVTIDGTCFAKQDIKPVIEATEELTIEEVCEELGRIIKINK